ncbi:GyrI-like domain-containing protein [Saccharibacillus kuerlensis]|uniref:AraC effector-binding domain-containing protein n=1 Tax=Saccharibacillus kuerlensis TaxID=459527 RepID=A0ABQ2KW34_9BACL|nr:effector binding domain-containing protein [Saccharibacillus kuerlensis]GGN94355.1 hypothetical protein GCM10010969_09020 [Saccharibacillus kuerlensis]
MNADIFNPITNNEYADFVTREAFTLTGYAVRTRNADEAESDGRLSGLWQVYNQSGFVQEAEVRDPHLIYALYTDYESDASGAYTVVLGHQCAPAASALPSSDKEDSFGDERFWASVPESRYRVFKTRRGPVWQVVAEAWTDIWAHFEGSSEQRAYTGDFEQYDTREFDPENAEVLIYIAVR